MLLRGLAVEHGGQGGQHVGLDQRMEHGEQHGDDHRQHKAHGHIVINQLRHQQAAEQRAEQSEAHGQRQGEVLQGLACALCAVGHDAAHQDHAVGQAAQGDGGIHVGQRRGQRDGVSAGGDGLEAEQLEQRADKNIHASAENVRAQEFVAVGTVSLRHAVKQAHHRLQHHLELAGNGLEAGNDEQAQQQRRHQDDAHYHQRGYVGGVHVLQPEQADAVRAVEHRVTHGLLHRLRLAVSGDKQRTGQERRGDQQPHHDEPDFPLFSHGS